MDPSEVFVGSRLRNQQLNSLVDGYTLTEESILLHWKTVVVGQWENELV
tara:strand:- start:324 stop:470 length:147 start_codon:yes stop_codon:yes gene_type:complete